MTSQMSKAAARPGGLPNLPSNLPCELFTPKRKRKPKPRSKRRKTRVRVTLNGNTATDSCSRVGTVIPVRAPRSPLFAWTTLDPALSRLHLKQPPTKGKRASCKATCPKSSKTVQGSSSKNINKKPAQTSKGQAARARHKKTKDCANIKV